MAKILLVEDDQSLREIYGIRLTAEGYEIVPAGDGEQALALAVKERPDLIISDVMMPKISGFDMLDILRSTPETKDIKVIMMTALSSEDQRERGEALGADRFLVKSQVGIEDVVNAVHEVLDAKPENTAVNQADFIQPGTAMPMNQSTPETQPIQPVQSTQPVQQIQTVQPVQTIQAEQTIQTAQPVQNMQNMQPAETVQPIQQVEPMQPMQPMQPAEPVQPSQPMQSSQTIGSNLTNDSYSINSVTDDSGMNIKDQMDQILGGMGTV
ncbi:response regulator [Candidatus Saccharibacteria bacterium]|jgi:PAS/PAC sensor hybrid histidine kinase|nr:response regulator [Candidatus Saccharibacteria bacterium]MBB1549518.1 response regulator [Candidatus Saccharibacteria bacterium]